MWRRTLWRCAGEYNFYSHIPCGMWRAQRIKEVSSQKFLLTHPVWDVTTKPPHRWLLIVISTHTSRVGCDITCAMSKLDDADFYSHIPCGMWRYIASMAFMCSSFLLTHPVWDVTARYLLHQFLNHISTHTSRVGCDSIITLLTHILVQFLLTHPVWDVTRLQHF